MNKKIMLLAIGACYILAGCSSSGRDDHDDHDHDNDHDGKGHGDEIVLTPEQIAAAGLETEVAEKAPFEFVIKSSGKLQTPQGAEQTISATASGIVHFTNSSLTEGSPIGGGVTIATISYKDLPDGDPAIKAKIALDAAEREYRRAEGLVGDKIISQKEFEQIRAEYELAKATYKNLTNSAGNGSKSVSTTMGGYVKQLMVREGEYVATGDPIAVVSQSRRLQLRAELPESGFRYINTISDANFKTAYDDETVYRISSLNGKVVSYGKSIEEGTPYIPIIFEFDNVGNFVGGTYAEVYLLGKGSKEAISVPSSALTEEQGLYFIYIQVDEEGFNKRQVTIGESNGKRVEITSGLNEGERVVTKGAYNVKLASNTSEIPHGHQH
jgi:RND family efflux transporter MFP subunit